jgi:hypothetical protein
MRFGRPVDGRIGKKNSHARVRAMLLKARDQAYTWREAGFDTVKVIGNQVATIAEWSDPNQLLVRRHGRQRGHQPPQVLGVGSGRNPSTTSADQAPGNRG